MPPSAANASIAACATGFKGAAAHGIKTRLQLRVHVHVLAGSARFA